MSDAPTNDCVFCKILTGEIPSRQVYADDDAVAFLDLAPFQPGHTLVIPREHVTDMITGSGELHRIAPAVDATARLLVDRLDAQGINLLSSSGAVAGQEVFHLHVHLVPRYADRPGLRNLFAQPKDAARDAELDRVHQVLTRDAPR